MTILSYGMRWFILSRLVAMYFSECSVVGVMMGTVSVISSPNPWRPARLAGLFEMSFILRTPRS